MDNWNYGAPPNEVPVLVEHNNTLIKVAAFYGRDGMRPHWESLDGEIHWSVDTFKRWSPCGDFK